MNQLRPENRNAAIDGLRGLSIVLVLGAHAAGTPHFLALSSLNRFGDVGNLGVSVFFVISGFLITTLLLRENERDRRIDLAGFYRRRAWKILPAAAAYLLTLSALPAHAQLSAADWVHALTFTMNYDQSRSWIVGHLWSLSVEEQFYVVWPAALVLLGRRRGLGLAGAAVVFAPLWRAIVWVHWPQARDGIGETFPTVVDEIAVGCVLAGCSGWLERQAPYRRFLASPLFAAVPAVVLACNVFDRYPAFYLPFGMTARTVGIAAIVHWSVVRQSRRASRILESWPMRSIGRISYSLYLWQQPFLDRHRVTMATGFPINIACAVACGLLSYACIESPALRLRDRLRHASRVDNWKAPEPPPVVVRSPVA